MERGSAQHGPRMDEELAEAAAALVRGAPVSARERADLDPEAPTEDEVDLVVGPDEPLGSGIDHERVLDRSELARWLLPSMFPGDAQRFVEGAHDLDAPDSVIVVLERLDPSMRYETFGDLWIDASGGEPIEPPPESVGESSVPASPAATLPTDALVGALSESEAMATATARGAGHVPPAPPGGTPGRPIVAGVLTTGFQLVTLPVRLTVAVAREAVRFGRRVLDSG
jgi:hypothetical protein